MRLAACGSLVFLIAVAMPGWAQTESDATLVEISKLLSANSSLKLHVVGHTDNVGTYASNMTLSKQRADAVVAVLVSKYHVLPARLNAAGAGTLAPVASNKTEDGRARNRRVELVEQCCGVSASFLHQSGQMGGHL